MHENVPSSSNDIYANLPYPVYTELGHFVERRTVRLIYFLPNDRPFRAEVVQRWQCSYLQSTRVFV